MNKKIVNILIIIWLVAVFLMKLKILYAVAYNIRFPFPFLH